MNVGETTTRYTPDEWAHVVFGTPLNVAQIRAARYIPLPKVTMATTMATKSIHQITGEAAEHDTSSPDC